MVMFENATTKKPAYGARTSRAHNWFATSESQCLAKDRAMAQKSSVVEFVQCDNAYRLNANEMSIRTVGVCFLTAYSNCNPRADKPLTPSKCSTKSRAAAGRAVHKIGK